MSDQDRQLATYLRESTQDLESDVVGLVAGGLARGRTRRRRRTRTTFAAFAVLGVVGAVGATTGIGALRTEGGPARDSVGVATDPSGSPSAPSPSAEPSPDTRIEPIGTTPIPATEIPVLFLTVHPGVLTEEEPTRAAPGPQTANFLWEGFATSAGAWPVTDGTKAPLALCQERNKGLADCVAQPDGSAIAEWESTADGVTARGVSLYDERGEVWVISYNAAEGKDATPLADEPPFTFPELAAVVRAPGWWR